MTKARRGAVEQAADERPRIYVSRQWVASSRRAWVWGANPGGRSLGAYATPAEALGAALPHFSIAAGAVVIIEPEEGQADGRD